MARKYTYSGLVGSWHRWSVIENGKSFEFYRHIQNESVREDIVNKYRELGFTDRMIQELLGQDILYGAVDFSTRDQFPFDNS